jgi:hypothetical protein
MPTCELCDKETEKLRTCVLCTAQFGECCADSDDESICCDCGEIDEDEMEDVDEDEYDDDDDSDDDESEPETEDPREDEWKDDGREKG